jgi:endonuclease YncB( thermonuclease family)
MIDKIMPVLVLFLAGINLFFIFYVGHINREKNVLFETICKQDEEIINLLFKIKMGIKYDKEKICQEVRNEFDNCDYDKLAKVTSPVRTYGNLIVKQLVSVYDGDTFTVSMPMLHPFIGRNIRVRINRKDPPEVRTNSDYEKVRGIYAKTILTRLLSRAKIIELRNIKRGKYFNIVADVYIDDVNLAKLMKNMGLAIPYNGKGDKWIDIYDEGDNYFNMSRIK